jgi:small subunit ribosomal protein S5
MYSPLQSPPFFFFSITSPQHPPTLTHTLIQTHKWMRRILRRRKDKKLLPVEIDFYKQFDPKPLEDKSSASGAKKRKDHDEDYDPTDEYDVIGDETLTLEEVMSRTAQNVSKGSNVASKGKLTQLREEINEWEIGDRGDGISTLVNTQNEPWAHMESYSKIEEAMENIDTPRRSLSPQEILHAAGYSMWYLYDDRVVKMTAKGKQQNFRALVCVGNGNGTAGYGIGKAASIPEAYDRALVHARKNLVWLDLKDGIGLYEPLAGTWNNTKVILRPPKKPGHFRCSDMVLAVANCFGIRELSAKTFGRKNPYVVMKAIFDAFQRFRTYEDMALVRGKRVEDVLGIRTQEEMKHGEYTRT